MSTMRAATLHAAAQDVDSLLKRQRSRRAFPLVRHHAQGQEAMRFRENYRSAQGTSQGWLTAYIQTELDAECDPRDPALRCAIRGALRCAMSHATVPEGHVGVRKTGTARGLAPGKRKRMWGGGRRHLSEELEEELWAWFVDRLGDAPQRLTTRHVLAAAQVIAADIREMFQAKVDLGEAEAGDAPRLPKLTENFVRRWRAKYGVTYRTVNLRYKISAAKRKARLGVFWSNCLRVRLFHEALFGPGLLRFIGFDQKPLWFNSCHNQQTLALRGAKRVAVKENTAASRERFTVMTTCPSWEVAVEGVADWLSLVTDNLSKAVPDAVARAPAETGDGRRGGETLRGAQGCEGSAAAGASVVSAPRLTALPAKPPIAVMFRSASENGERMRQGLRVPANVLLQFAPRGSYRLDNVDSFLRWAVPPAASPRDAIVVVLDWYKPHLDSKVAELLHGNNHGLLLIGGGITGDVQVGDTHRHGPYTKRYRERENNESNSALRLRPKSMPVSTRQAVLERAADAWADMTHTGLAREWAQNGILNALDGTEDACLRDELYPVWLDLNMPQVRESLRGEIAAKVADGTLTEWAQYPSLLEAYDDHAPLREGMEVAIQMVEDAPGGPADDDVRPDAEAPADVLAEAEDAADGEHEAHQVAAARASDETSAGLVSRLLPPEVVQQARGALACVHGGERLQALADSIEALRKVGEHAAATALQHRLQSRVKADKRLDKDTRLYLRGKAMERGNQDRLAREAAAADDRRRQEADMQVRLAKAEAEKTKASTEARKAEVKLLLQEAQVKKAAVKAAVAEELVAKEQRRCTFMDFIMYTTVWYFQHKDSGERRRSRALQAAEKYRQNRVPLPACPEPWERTNRKHYIEATPGPAIHLSGKSHRPHEWASEGVALRLFQNTHPQHAQSARTVGRRADDWLKANLPGYDRVCAGWHGIVEQVAIQSGNVDLALFEVVWRYSHAVGKVAFPVGIHCWPPDAEQASLHASFCAERAALGMPSGAARASSAPSGAARASPASSGAASAPLALGGRGERLLSLPRGGASLLSPAVPSCVAAAPPPAAGEVAAASSASSGAASAKALAKAPTKAAPHDETPSYVKKDWGSAP